ncbi:MAG TPA: lysophospholipid acyltransferase family protein [Cyclobacteriaceae bacterium]|nr:1-acyl-sn-glycerol-3-phosphate acyltransferase [Cyclobacteriaceae bacterium]HRK52588.1 lysophospholipid acyltransferase family protein [Cyclobacteriaceae bacterium]
MQLLKKVYTAYGMLIFGLLFVVFFIPLLIPIFFPKQFKLVGVFNRWWARSLYFFLGIPWNLEYKTKLDPKKQYIFAPNHFSFIDIPTMGLNTHSTIFVGKSEMESVPVFGWMYKHLHITVDRTKLRSMYDTLMKSLKALDEGKSLTIFIEGGIYTKQPPIMARLKDGAFRAAIEKQIPIVPVTIPHNWILLPVEPMLLSWVPTKIIFHEPVDVTGMTLDDMNTLKEKVYNIIDAELKKENPGILKDED